MAPHKSKRSGDDVTLQPIHKKLSLKKFKTTKTGQPTPALEESQKSVKANRKQVKKSPAKKEPGSSDSEEEECYEAVLVEDYLNVIESTDELSRNNSELLETFSELQGLTAQLAGLMDNLKLDTLDLEFDEISSDRREVLKKMLGNLMTCDKLTIHGTKVTDDTEIAISEKTHILKIDEKNLNSLQCEDEDEKAPEAKARSKNANRPSLISRDTPVKITPPKTEPRITNPPHSASSGGSSQNSRLSSRQSTATPPEDRRVTTATRNILTRKSNPSTPQKPASQQSNPAKKTPKKKSPMKKPPTPKKDSDSMSEYDSSDEEAGIKYCTCEKNSFGKMVKCDNDLCPVEWFHFKCVCIKKPPKGIWFCPICRGDTPEVRKTREEFYKELDRYNKRKEASNLA